MEAHRDFTQSVYRRILDRTLAMGAQIASASTPAASAFVFDEARYKAILATPAAHKMCFGSTYTGAVRSCFS